MTLRSPWSGVLVVVFATCACGGKLEIGSHGDARAGAGASGGAGMSGSGGMSGMPAAGVGGTRPDVRPLLRRVVSIAVGETHNCVLFDDGSVHCWGYNASGLLGLGSLEPIFVGDDETPASIADIDIGGRAKQLAVGHSVTCVVLDDGAVRCWGATPYGSLGYGDQEDVGDDEVPAEVGPVEVGGSVVQIATSGVHTCAVLVDQTVRCWGEQSNGRLGYGNRETIGDNETPASAGEVDVGGPVQKVVTGDNHTCALLTNGAVRCWGLAITGALGYGNTRDIGDDETPASAGDVDLGGRAIDLGVGLNDTCAILEGGGVRCWGATPPRYYPETDVVGDDETPASAPLVDVGASAEKISVANGHICVLLESHAVRCWGYGSMGVLGYGNTNDIGDDETPADAGDLELGGRALEIRASRLHICALLENGKVRCWGGQVPEVPEIWDAQTSALLGQGDLTQVIGDDEFPDAYDPVVIP